METSQIDTGPLFGPHLRCVCLHLLKIMNHSFRVWLLTPFPVGLSVQPAVMDPTLAQPSGMQRESRHVTLTDGKVLTVSGR